jgi:F-type H+-transporting ATPase subunit alpha
VEKQILIIFAGTNGYLDDVPVPEVRRYERELFAFIETNHPAVLKNMADKKKIDDELRAQMTEALDSFAERFSREEKA